MHRPITIYVTRDFQNWMKEQAKKKRMTESSYCMWLMSRGMAVDALDEAAARLQLAERQSGLEELLRQTLATRWMVEQGMSEGRSGALLAGQADAAASRALERIKEKLNDDQSKG